MRSFSACLPILSLLLLPGAAAFAQAMPVSPTRACGPVSAEFKTTRGAVGPMAPLPDASKATVYVIEVYDLADKGRFNRPTVRVGLNGQWVGATQGFSFVRFAVGPGEQHLCSQWQSVFGHLTDQVSLYNMPFEAGKTYFFRIQILNDGTGKTSGPGVIDLEPVSTDEGELLLSEAAESISTPK